MIQNWITLATNTDLQDADLHNVLGPNETISGRQVPMDVIVPLQVRHTPAHLHQKIR